MDRALVSEASRARLLELETIHAKYAAAFRRPGMWLDTILWSDLPGILGPQRTGFSVTSALNHEELGALRTVSLHSCHCMSRIILPEIGRRR